jgi:MoaA/NifB/PqqE/SkfB family radical SAM enzyme
MSTTAARLTAENAIVALMRQFNKSASSRHLLELKRHATVRKLLNLAVVEFQRRFLRSARLFGYPYWMVVGVTSSCQLECPGCPKGLRLPDHRRKRAMSEKEFERVIDQVKPYVFNVAFNAWGEAFLNKQIFKMIRYAAAQNIGTLVSANLNDLPKNGAEQVVQSGLERLVVSVDGTTQESYARYRINGNLERVLENMRAIVAERRRQGSVLPHIAWQFLLFDHNQDEVDRARELAKEIGVDEIYFMSAGNRYNDPRFDTRLRDDVAEKYYKENQAVEAACARPWYFMEINSDGGVSPCCDIEAYDGSDDFGNLLTTPLKKIWNNEKYKESRKLFQVKGYKPKVDSVCTDCYRVKEFNENPKATTAPAYYFASALLRPVESILDYRASRRSSSIS